ncbi:SGNH hydrolase domain-containing protein [Kitasatospora sp. SolWspMP-SS2h]|uniref:SGNH hydrolase domain-containing protein n=1 Tax=Kitasatospora sp. SolWspMP-SS2h TaxID=1305729 RepID=UPI000DBAB7DF
MAPSTAPRTAPLTVVLHRPPVERPAFRPDIEGLRAVAVLAVLAFHAAVPGLAGGFVGVDVFFVVSGYLITGLLRTETGRHGRVRLAEFYSRRARRLLPSAAVVLAATAVLGALLTAPLRRADLERDVLASALSVANWRFIAEQTDYLAAGRDPSALLHFWSLAVEEQFYLLWAPLLALAARWAWRRRTLLGLTLLLGAGSFWLSLHWSAGAYLSTPTRAWQFAAGAAIALLPVREFPRLVRELLGLGGLAGVLVAVLLFDGHTRYPGYAALLPTAATAAIVLAGPAGPHLVGRALSLGAPRAVGRLSYHLYLWHWPVLVLAEAHWGALPWGAGAALTAAAALPAYAALRWLEQPLRRSPVLGEIPRRGLSLGLAAVVLPVLLALVVGSGTIRDLGPATPPDPSGLPPGARTGSSLLAAAPPPHAPTVPNPVQARQDFPPDGGCEVGPADTTSPPCRFGTGEDRIVLLGDSHAGQWFSALLGIAAQHRLSVEELVKQGCPLAEITVTNPQLGRTYHECDTWRANVLARLKDGPKPKLVVVSALNRYTADRAALLRGWERTLAPLRELGVPVVYLQDTPVPGRDVPACVSGHPGTTSACDFPRAEGLYADPLAERIAAGAFPGVRTVEVDSVLCPADGRSCPAVLEHVLLYRDDSHLTNAAAVVLTPRLDRLLTDAGVFGTGWTTLLHDGFDGPAGSRPDPATWQYDLGTCYPGCPAAQWGTGEVETMTDAAENVRLDGAGALEITPTRDPAGRWSSGRIESRRADLAAPAGGGLRVEAELALPDVHGPAAAGYWPAFWALGGGLRDGSTGWPGVGELDVLESVGGRGVFGTLHCGTTPGGPCREPSGLGSGEQPCADCWGAFHTYTVEVDRSTSPELVRWLRDGRECFRVTADRVDPAAWDRAVHHGIFLVLDVAVGGDLPAAYGSPPAEATEPGHPMKVASVTVSTRQ